MVGGAALFEGTAEKLCHIVFDAHCREHYGEILIGITAEGSLLYDLRGKLVVGQTVSGKDRQLLAADQGGQPVDSGNTGVDIVTGIFPGNRVQRKAVDVQPYFRGDFAQPVDGLSDTVEGPAQNLGRQPDLHGVPGKPCMCVAQRHAVGTFKHLDHSLVFIDLDNTADLMRPVVHVELHDLFIGGVFHTFKDNQRAVYFA